MSSKRPPLPVRHLMSALLAAEADGDKLSEDDLLGFCFLLLIAATTSPHP